MAGRPAGKDLDAGLISKIAESVRAGSSIEVACALAGVSEAELERWMKTGKRLIAKHRRGLKRDFVEALRQAEARFNAEILGYIRENASRSWQAAAWILERRFPMQYARTETRKAGAPAVIESDRRQSWVNMIRQAEEENSFDTRPADTAYPDEGKERAPVVGGRGAGC